MPVSQTELKRGFGPWTATFVVMASMVGTGILVSPGYMMLSLGHQGLIFGLWLAGGLLAMAGALCVAELATMFPRAGGEYVYLREAYGPLPAFLSGWTSYVLGFAAPLAVAAHVAAVYFVGPFISDDGGPLGVVRLAAAGLILLITLPNALGHRQSALAQNAMTVLNLGLFVALIIAALFSGQMEFDLLQKPSGDSELRWTAVPSQLFYVLFAFSGWNAASYLAGEVRDPARTLPRALIAGSGLVLLLYLGLMLVFATAVPMALVTPDNAERIPLLAVERLFGAEIAGFFSIAIGTTFLSTVNAYIVTGPRVTYAMAKDGLFPAVAGAVHPRTGIPVNAMIAQMAMALLILFAIDFQSLYQFAAVGLSLFAVLFIAAVFVLRQREPKRPRPFRIPLYPFTPALFIAVTVFMAGFAFLEWPGPSIWSLCTILGGVPLYGLWRHFGSRASAKSAADQS